MRDKEANMARKPDSSLSYRLEPSIRGRRWSKKKTADEKSRQVVVGVKIAPDVAGRTWSWRDMFAF